MIRDLVSEGLIPAPLDGPAKRYTPLGAVTDIACHHMTGWNPPADAPVDWEIRFLRGIDEYHRSSRGLDGIGYHIVPMSSGRIYIVSRLDRYGAGVGGENNHLLHLALPGDYTYELPSPGHLAAAVEATRHLYGYLGREVSTTPHLYWGGTACPGARWPEWVPQLAKEEDMPNEQWFIQLRNDGVALVNEEVRREASAVRKHIDLRRQESQTQIDRRAREIVDAIAAVSSGSAIAGASPAEVLEAAKQALREGGG